MQQGASSTAGPSARWTEAGAGYIASCGELGQGVMIVAGAGGGGFAWVVDMLPDDIEPAIIGTAETLAAAQAAAERQAACWPGLIEGAKRRV